MSQKTKLHPPDVQKQEAARVITLAARAARDFIKDMEPITTMGFRV